MKILSAATDCRTPGPLLALDRLLPVVNLALTEAGLTARDLDLIATISISPDRVAIDPAILGPRVGHPLQRAIGASRAYVFDMLDASLAKVMHAVDIFAHAQRYENVLIVRTDHCAGLDLQLGSDLHLPDGALAMACRPDGRSRFSSAALADLSPAVTLADRIVRDALDVKATMRFASPPDLAARYGAAMRIAISRLPATGRSFTESWFSPDANGPFSIGVDLRAALVDNYSGSAIAVSFDPFSPAADAVSLQCGAHHD
ncbi:MAG: hypothetical protein JO067_01110 [Cupriavidus sp.]|nr:hypothetical protein [Cupriavidus sp.]